MEEHMFGGAWGSLPYPGSNANASANDNQFMFDAKSAPQQLQLFGSNAGMMMMLIIPLCCIFICMFIASSCCRVQS
jgi:hypothetical protein